MDKSGLPLKTTVEHYLAACRMEGKTAKTLEGYEEKLLRLVRGLAGTLGEFPLPYVVALQDSPRWSNHSFIPATAERLSPGTVADHVRVLKGLATSLQEEGYLPENVLRRLAPPKVPSLVIEILNEEEIRRLLGAVDANSLNGARDLAILVLFLDTGLRLNELVGLRVDDVHFEEQWLKVMGKGRKERIVPFGARATKVMLR